MRLLVALDRGAGGRDALELARVLALGGEASALVVTVLSTGPLPIAYALLDEEAHEADEHFEQARAKLDGLEVETRAYGGGSPAAVLTELAEEEEFDAIVVGSPHRGVIGRVLAGSTALALLSGAPTDVAVAPRGYERGEPPRQAARIVVGYDGSAESGTALRRAEGLAKRSHARIEIATVVGRPVAIPAPVPMPYPETPFDPEGLVADALASVDPAVAAKSIRLDGDPATELTRACTGDDDLLVLGSRGYGPLTRALLGSVSRKVVRDAACPVLVARRP